MLILKFYLAPPNRDIGMFVLSSFKYFNLKGGRIILQSLEKAVLEKQFVIIWPVFIVMFLLQPRRYFYKKTKVLTLFFILYLLCIFLIYLTTVHFDLEWRLSRTMVRILMIQLPAMMFLHFYAYFFSRG